MKRLQLTLLAILLGCRVPGYGSVDTPPGPEVSSIQATVSDRQPVDALTVIVYDYRDYAVDRAGIRRHKEKPTQSAARLEAQIEQYLVESERPIRIVKADAFREATFPWLYREEMPLKPKSLRTLISNREFRRRLDPLGIRYLVLVGGEATHEHERGSVNLYGAGGYGGAIVWFWGTVVWDNESALNALIVDLVEDREVDRIEHKAEDESSFGVYTYLPVTETDTSGRDAAQRMAEMILSSIEAIREARAGAVVETPEKR